MRKTMREQIGDVKDPMVQEQLQEAKDERKILIERTVDKWDKQKIYERVSDNWNNLSDVEKTKTSIYLENQERHLKLMNETQISSAFGTTPEKVLEIVRLASPNANRGNIFREIPMLSTDDAFYFLNTVYDNSPAKTRSSVTGNTFESVDRYFASEMEEDLIDTGDGATKVFSNTLGTVPVRPYTAKLTVGGVHVGTDDGAGGWVSALLDPAGTNDINYTTGVVNLEFLANVALGDDIEVEYHWDSEESGNYDELGELLIEVVKYKLDAKPQPIGFSWSKLAELTLGSTGLGDAEAILLKAAGEELMKALDYRAIGLARRVALSNAQRTFDTDFAAAGADNEVAHAQLLSAHVNAMGNDIYNDLKRGGITRIVAGAGAVTYMELHKTWVADNSQPKIGLHLVGTFNSIPVFKCPADNKLVKNDEILGVFKNDTNEGETSIAFGTYIPMLSLGTLTRPQQFRTEGALAHFGDKVIIQNKFIRLLTLDNLQF